jgi:tRNA nucleotidyltransferase (CCA-adding enzyme)
MRNLASQLRQNLPTQWLRLLQVVGEVAKEQGQGVYLVGGTVRDLLLERANFDLDLVVEGDAPKLASLLSQRERGEVVIHHRFGTAKFRGEDLSIDIATARAESYPHPGALPSVRLGSIGEDLFRRDFTINAMAIHLDLDNFGKLIDLYGGEDDLEHGLIRTLHEKSFVDDATRILRALRYEQRLGFQLETTTERLLRRDLAMLDTISGDRIRHELDLILKEEYPEGILRRAGNLGVLSQIYPLLRSNGWLEEKFRQARSSAHPPSLALYFSLMVYHLSPEKGEHFIKQFKIPGAVAKVIRDTLHLKENMEILAIPDLLPSTIYERLQGYSSSSILACALASDSSLVSQRLYLYLDKLRYIKTSLGGEALQKMGIPPGQRLGEILRSLHQARLDQKVKTREEEEEMVRHLFKESQGR